MIKRDVIDGIDFDATSWKILIELLVKGDYTRVVELPYFFHAREIGVSKLSVTAQIDYIRHMKTLFFSRELSAICLGRGRMPFQDPDIDRIVDK